MESKNSAKIRSKRKATKRKSTNSGDLQMDSVPIKSPYFSNSASHSSELMMSKASKLTYKFFNQPCIDLARQLLGQVFVRVINGQRLAGMIVETEAYVGEEDTACHTFKGRKTKSNGSMFLNPGHAYVYMTYGMYHCINITSDGYGQAVLLRALAPREGIPSMTELRQKASKRPKDFKLKELSNGPGKLSLSLDIDRKCDGTDLTASDSSMWIESGDQILDKDIVSCPRIGIDSATKEWVEKPLRFYVRGDPCVSKRNRAAEDG